MLMRMLEAGGLPPLTDRLRQADDDNPRGYYELEAVKKLRDGENGFLDDAPGKAVKVISALLADLPADRSYRVLFMQRRIAEVLASQRRMLERRAAAGQAVIEASDDIAMAAYFEQHLERVRAWLAAQPNFKVLYLDYNTLLADPQPQVQAIGAFLPAKLDQAAMLGVIDPGLYRQRRVEGEA